jgi:hypothetical protein
MGVVYRAIDNRLKRAVALKDSGPIRYISAGKRVAGKRVLPPLGGSSRQPLAHKSTSQVPAPVTNHFIDWHV